MSALAFVMIIGRVFLFMLFGFDLVDLGRVVGAHQAFVNEDDLP